MSFETEMDLNFESDDELKKGVPAGTIAKVAIRPDRDGTLGDFKTGEGQYGPWMLLQFEVVEGEYRGEWASTIVTVKTTDRKFRAIFEVVTGIDIAGGANVSFKDFQEKLVSGIFEVELGPEVKKGVETGYTAVKKFRERVGERDTASDSAAAEAPAISSEPAAAGNDEDIPF